MILSAAAAAATASCGCRRHEGEAQAATPTTAPAQTLPDNVVDAGPLSDFPDSQVYDQFREEGFFIIRRAMEVFAMSSICTHRHCKIQLQDDGSFQCFCHGSIFDPDGHVVKGPAKKDLPRLPVARVLRGDGEHLLVRK